MRSLLALLVLALVAGGLWFLLADDGPPAGPGAVVPTVEEPEPEVARSAPEAPVAPEQQPELPETTEPEREAVAAPVTEAPLPEGLTAPDPAGLLFRVVHADTGEPVPGASLTYMGSATAMSAGAEELLAAGAGLDAVLERFGRHYRCDERGEVRVGDLEADAIVRARGVAAGVRLAGLLETQKHLGDVIEVPVGPELGFDVTVVDPDGAPVVGATVELQILMTMFGPEVRYPIHAGETGTDGRVFLSNILLEMGEDSLGLVDGETRVVVALAGFYATRPELDVDWQATTPAKLELVQPPVGRVEVTVVDEGGTDLNGGHVLLVPAGERTDPDVGPPSRSLFRGIQQAEDAVVVFDAVERGECFDLVLGSTGSAEIASLDGLQLGADQDRLQVRLVAAGQPRLAARVLAPDGDPLAGAEVVIGREQSWDGSLDRLAVVTTDDEGHFEVLAPWITAGNLALSRDLGGDTELRAHLGDLSDLAAAGPRVDLGDVRLRTPGLLAGGRVVDHQGRGRAVPLTLMVAELPADGPEGGFESYRRWNAMSAPDGTFQFHGDSPAVRLRLTCSADDFRGEPLVFDTGRGDLRLELTEACRLAFTLPGVDPELLEALFLVIEPTSGTSQDDRIHADVEPNRTTGLIQSPPLPPGELRMRLVLGAEEDAPLVEAVVLLEPGEARDLGPLQLTRAVHAYRITLDLTSSSHPSQVQLSAYGQGAGDRQRMLGYTRRTSPTTWVVHALEPVSHVRLYHDDLAQPAHFDLVEGENTLTLALP